MGGTSDMQVQQLAAALKLFASALEPDEMATFETIFEYGDRRFQLIVKEVFSKREEPETNKKGTKQ